MHYRNIYFHHIKKTNTNYTSTMQQRDEVFRLDGNHREGVLLVWEWKEWDRCISSFFCVLRCLSFSLFYAHEIVFMPLIIFISISICAIILVLINDDDDGEHSFLQPFVKPQAAASGAACYAAFDKLVHEQSRLKFLFSQVCFVVLSLKGFVLHSNLMKNMCKLKFKSKFHKLKRGKWNRK